MAASNPRYLIDWRSTMTLIPRDYNTKSCGDPGKTFRGPHARVENSINRDDPCAGDFIPMELGENIKLWQNQVQQQTHLVELLVLRNYNLH